MTVWIRVIADVLNLDIKGNIQNLYAKGLFAGCLVYGEGVDFYRSLETVSKGAESTIYTIFNEKIKLFYKRCGIYPAEELYVQLDGGSENANK